MFLFHFWLWLLPEKLSFCPKNNGFARVYMASSIGRRRMKIDSRSTALRHGRENQRTVCNFGI